MKPFRLLIGYDGSACAGAALRDLALAGLPEHMSVQVLSVADTFVPPTSDARDPSAPPWLQDSIRRVVTQSAQELRRARSLAMKAKSRLQQNHPSWRVRAVARADHPAWALIKCADLWKPDLIVMGSHRHFSWGRFWLGSVSRKVLTHARCSVRIVRREPRKSRRAPRILIGFDGSASSMAAIHRVAGRSWPPSTRVRVVTVQDSQIKRFFPTSQKTAETFWRDSVAPSALRVLRAAGLTADFVFREGDPKSALLEEARRWKADCLFLGARGLTGVERFLISRVSDAVASHAPCAVEIVRESAR